MLTTIKMDHMVDSHFENCLFVAFIVDLFLGYIRTESGTKAETAILVCDRNDLVSDYRFG